MVAIATINSNNDGRSNTDRWLVPYGSIRESRESGHCHSKMTSEYKELHKNIGEAKTSIKTASSAPPGLAALEKAVKEICLALKEQSAPTYIEEANASNGRDQRRWSYATIGGSTPGA